MPGREIAEQVAPFSVYDCKEYTAGGDDDVSMKTSAPGILKQILVFVSSIICRGQFGSANSCPIWSRSDFK